VELKKLHKNTIEVSKNLNSLVAIAGEKNKEELADLNVSQLEKGISGDGKKMKPDYSKPYAAFKGFKTPNLKVEGTYHESIDMEAKADKWLFYSKNEGSKKVNFLEDHYNNTQYGIAPQNEQKAADEIEPDLFKEVENGLQKGIV
jgi:hypothetical protein